MNKTIKISCVIRTYNEDDCIRMLIETLMAQPDYGYNVEIVVVDSGSTDATVAIVKELKVKLIEIPKADFNYSKALNLGIENCSGDLIIILSVHVMLREENWISSLLRTFEDPQIAGVYCKQVPWPNAPWHEILRIETTFGDKSKVFCQDDFEAVMMSNAASCIRRSAWLKHNFVIMPAAEDREWARWAVDNGYKIAYDAGISVYHSHAENPRATASRKIAIEKATDIQFGRRRTMLFNLRQAIGWIIRDSRSIFRIEPSRRKRMKFCMQTLACAFWYFVDFTWQNERILPS